MKKKKIKNAIGKKSNPCNMETTMDTFALKFYDEQIPEGFANLKEKISKIDKNTMQVLCIKHDRDTKKETFWEVSTEKPHYHLIGRFVGGKKGYKLRTILNIFNIVYRNPEDEKLLENHGAEKCGNFTSYSVYLTHETKQAIKECKFKYDVEDIVSNCNIEEIKMIRAGYVRPDVSYKITDEEMEALDKEAYDIGYSLGDFEKWYYELPVKIRANTRMKEIEKHYFRGVMVRYEEDRNINRLCIFIKGDAAVGKSYTSDKTVRALGILPLLAVDGGGTGKFDELKCYTQTMILDDYSAENMLNLSDNKFCKAYRRNRNNPIWAGKLLIVTANKTFDNWLDDCRITDKKQREAMHTRFYECEIENRNGRNYLICSSDKASKRGTPEEQFERLELFKKFQQEFNNIMSKYKPFDGEIDYSGLDLIESKKIINITSSPKWTGIIHDIDTNIVEEMKWDVPGYPSPWD